MNWANFLHTVIGAVFYEKNVIKDFRSREFLKESNKDLLFLDMIIWLQVDYINRTNVYQAKFFINQDSKLFTKTKEISEALKLIEY